MDRRYATQVYRKTGRDIGSIGVDMEVSLLNMRGAMPSSDSVLFLLGSVALQTTETTYARPIAIFRDWVTLRPLMHPATSKEDSSLDA